MKKRNEKTVRAGRGVQSLYCHLDHESAEILAHCQAFVRRKLGMKVTDAVLMRRALQALIEDWDEKTRFLRRAKRREKDSEVISERNVLQSLADPYQSSALCSPANDQRPWRVPNLG